MPRFHPFFVLSSRLLPNRRFLDLKERTWECVCKNFWKCSKGRLCRSATAVTAAFENFSPDLPEGRRRHFLAEFCCRGLWNSSLRLKFSRLGLCFLKRTTPFQPSTPSPRPTYVGRGPALGGSLVLSQTHCAVLSAGSHCRDLSPLRRNSFTSAANEAATASPSAGRWRICENNNRPQNFKASKHGKALRL